MVHDLFSYYNLAEKFDVTAASSQLAQILETGDKVGRFCQHFIVTNACLFFLGDIDIYGDSLWPVNQKRLQMFAVMRDGDLK